MFFSVTYSSRIATLEIVTLFKVFAAVAANS